MADEWIDKIKIHHHKIRILLLDHELNQGPSITGPLTRRRTVAEN
jgi:hypothetical protein